MDLIWWIVAIAGCLALAGCVVVALMWPRRQAISPRPMANTRRLTGLPAYVRAVRRHTVAACVAGVLLVVAFAAAVLAAARPTGLPSSAHRSAAPQPEDIMVCIGGPVTDPAVSATLRYFAGEIPTLGTERIGLTSANRRVVPMTRDYQYAAAQFARYARAAETPSDVAGFVAPVSYSDYSRAATDVLAMCLTGFPAFQEKVAQRRSLIYVGPDIAAGSGSPLFTGEQVRKLAVDADIQINAMVTGGPGEALTALARDTGGRAYAAGADATAHVEEIRDHRPAATAAGTAMLKSAEAPDVPLTVALIAVAAALAWGVVIRR